MDRLTEAIDLLSMFLVKAEENEEPSFMSSQVSMKEALHLPWIYHGNVMALHAKNLVKVIISYL